ncbi:hypothetical protein FKM82_024313 [Ascaphus truei]
MQASYPSPPQTLSSTANIRFRPNQRWLLLGFAKCLRSLHLWQRHCDPPPSAVPTTTLPPMRFPSPTAFVLLQGGMTVYVASGTALRIVQWCSVLLYKASFYQTLHGARPCYSTQACC